MTRRATACTTRNMWVLKAIAALCCVAVAGLTGRRLGRRYVLRDKVLSDFAALTTRLGTDIGFFQTPISALLTCQNEWLCPESQALTAAYLAAIAADAPVAEAVQARRESKCVSAADLALIIRFFGVLGKSDSATQVVEMHAYHEIFSALARDSAAERKKFSALYTKLVILCGAAVGILVL